MLRARTQREYRQHLRARIDGQPYPQHLRGAAQPRAQFVQLQVRESQMVEGPLVQRLSVLACPREPPRDGGLSGAEHPRGRRGIQPFGQCSQYHGNLVRRGFQAIQGGVASSTEGGVARLAAERLDRLSTTMFTVADQGVDVRFCVPEVRALPVGTGKALSGDALRSSSPAFDLAPGTY